MKRLAAILVAGLLVGLLLAGTAFPGGREPVDRCARAGEGLRAEREPWSARVACSSVGKDGRRRVSYVSATTADWAWLVVGAAAGGVVGLLAGGVLVRRRATA